MMKKNNLVSMGTLLLMILMIPSAYAGGGWTQKKKQGYFKLSQYAIRADRLFSMDKSIQDIITTSVYTTSVYGEYGFSDKVTAIAYIPFFVRSTINNVEERDGSFKKGDEVNSFGDPNLALKYALVSNKNIALSASLTLGFPLGNPTGGEGKALQTGDGEFNQMLMLEASHSFYPTNAYATVMTGFNHRTKGFSEEFRFGVEAGYGLGKFWFIGRMNNVTSFMNGDGPSSGSGQGLFSNNVEFTSVSLDIMYSFSEKIGVSGSIAGAVSGRQILASPAFDLGIFMNLK